MTQLRTYIETARQPDEWVDLLRANCLLLVERPEVARAVSISRGFPHGAERARDTFVGLARRMAEEYGLAVEIELEGVFVAVRFSSRQVEPSKPVTVRSEKSFGRRWRRFLSHGRADDGAQEGHRAA